MFLCTCPSICQIPSARPRLIHPFQRLSPHICNNDISPVKKTAAASHMLPFLLRDYYCNYDVTHGVRQVILRLWSSPGMVHLLLRPQRRFLKRVTVVDSTGGCDNRFDCELLGRLSGCIFNVGCTTVL